MADTPEHNEHPPTDVPPDAGGVPVEEEHVEDEAPRRAASAEFVVESEIGSQALLREAMDPANQSLREALRLSFRVLQAVILVLVVLFFFSGFQTVQDGQSGVMLRWGKILGEPGQQALDPGLKFSKWPYPAGEFVLFNEKDRHIDVPTRVFWPDIGGQTFEDAVESANINAMLHPDRDGSLITAGGDLVHIKLSADYGIDGPVAFLGAVENENPDAGELDADRLVTLAMQRAAVHAAARRSVEDLVNFSEQDTIDLKREAQGSLDRLMDGRGAGIRIAAVDLPVAPTPPLAIKKTQDQLHRDKESAKQGIERARASAADTLVTVAGERYQALLDLIGQYETALDLGQVEQSEQILATINAHLEGPEVSGTVNRIIERARSYSSHIESTLGAEASRFASALPRFRENPEAFVARHWASAYQFVLTRADAERFYVPESVGAIRITLAGYDQIRQTRRDKMLDREQSQAIQRGMGANTPFTERGRDMERGRLGKAGRRLDPTGGSLAEDR